MNANGVRKSQNPLKILADEDEDYWLPSAIKI